MGHGWVEAVSGGTDLGLLTIQAQQDAESKGRQQKQVARETHQRTDARRYRMKQANRRMEDEQVDDQSVSGTGCVAARTVVVRLGIRMQLQRDTKHRHEPQ